MEIEEAYTGVAASLRRYAAELIQQADFLERQGDAIKRARSLAEVSNTDGRHPASTRIDAGSNPAGHAIVPEMGSSHEQVDCPDPESCPICSPLPQSSEDRT